MSQARRALTDALPQSLYPQLSVLRIALLTRVINAPAHTPLTDGVMSALLALTFKHLRHHLSRLSSAATFLRELFSGAIVLKPTSRGGFGWCATNLGRGRIWVRIPGKAWVCFEFQPHVPPNCATKQHVGSTVRKSVAGNLPGSTLANRESIAECNSQSEPKSIPRTHSANHRMGMSTSKFPSRYFAIACLSVLCGGNRFISGRDMPETSICNVVNFINVARVKCITARVQKRGKQEIPEINGLPAGSSSTILKCDKPGATPPETELGLTWWEVRALAAASPQPPERTHARKSTVGALQPLQIRCIIRPLPPRERMSLGCACVDIQPGRQYITSDNHLMARDVCPASSPIHAPLSLRLTWLSTHQFVGCINSVIHNVRHRRVLFLPQLRCGSENKVPSPPTGTTVVLQSDAALPNWKRLYCITLNRARQWVHEQLIMQWGSGQCPPFRQSSWKQVGIVQIHYLPESNWGHVRNVCSAVVIPLEFRRATSCGYNSSHSVSHALYKCLQDINGDSSPLLLQPFHELSNGFWPRLTSPHPVI
ncbi:hypothetical protein PR048_014779 [Dryococelus australis]|uniref:Uncharacterized protein n=1 Tax=Dryococelus australis TaxID=614101 RepID=A0ABQ9HFC3_9NEOP|nr:hypothetical protein PR048_014779 [Dryococelus australis]